MTTNEDTTGTQCDCGHARILHALWGCTGVAPTAGPMGAPQWCPCPQTQEALRIQGVVEGEGLRDAGMGQVLGSTNPDAEDWRVGARAWISSLPRGHRFTSTDMTDVVGVAPSPNAVGAIIRVCALQDLITNTGEYVKSSRPRARAHRVAVWARA